MCRGLEGKTFSDRGCAYVVNWQGEVSDNWGHMEYFSGKQKCV